MSVPSGRDPLVEAESLFWALHRVALSLCGELPSEGSAPPPEIRGRPLAALQRLHAGLADLTGRVGRLAATGGARRQAEQGALRAAIAAPGPPSRPPAPPPGLSAGPPPGGRLEVALAPGIALEAVPVPPDLEDPRDIFDAVATPELYYIARWDHFAVRVGAAVFHGNLGNVSFPGLSEEKGGRRRECRRPGCRGAAGGCPRYHDPARHPGARDVRDFGAESWAPAGLSGGGRGRALCSRATLVGDLGAATSAAIRRQLDLTAHEVLCGVILAKYGGGALLSEAAAAPAGLGQ